MPHEASPSQRPGSSWYAALSCALMLSGGLGCGTSPDIGPLVPVRGVVLYNGAPLPKAEITLHPRSEGHPGWLPVGRADDSGRFEVGTQLPGDGAPPGRYAVTVVWRPDAERDDSAPNLLPASFASPDLSGLELVADADPDRPITLELTGRPLAAQGSPR